ncbi:MAG: putative tryptophan/tyrosine transport system ATP-binding protein [Desulfomicrobiaceae bacterium]|nr:putative tryptophan/tyrosine transport system ATP-binding protein [Desulfomicrobiaceae bacterium]MDK2872505.1 putative tryptophan/tyrosine transport system ATP-binding protein [Desulfomicrobiaceae bacterium]
MISIRGIQKWFHRGTPQEVHALRGVDLEVAPGDFITIIGSNGAGKSTMLSCIAGALGIDAGSIHFHDTDVTSWPEYRRAGLVARVFQDPLRGTFGGGTIAQNLALALRRGAPRGLRPGVRRHELAFFQERLATLGLGLEHRLHDRVALLSGGQRQALTMVMATLRRPELLLLDEHTAALDPKTAAHILELTERTVAEHGITTLMVTHNMAHAIALGNRLVMMHHGRIVLETRGAEKAALTVTALLDRFHDLNAASDRMILS